MKEFDCGRKIVVDYSYIVLLKEKMIPISTDDRAEYKIVLQIIVSLLEIIKYRDDYSFA